MTTFVCSDLHFGHRNILKYCMARRRGKDMPTQLEDIDKMVSSMNEHIIANWNSVIEPDDDVYVLGDCCMGQIDHTHRNMFRLNGKKYLVRGNHDKTLTKPREGYARSYADDIFEWVKDVHEMSVKIGTEKIHVFMSHYPHAFWNHSGSGAVHLHGHCHGSPTGIEGRIFDVGIDTNNLYPYRLNNVIEQMLKINDVRKHHGD